MAHKRTIAIIGATGNTGKVIARRLAKSDHRLLLISTDKEQLLHVVNDLLADVPQAEVEGMDCMFDASWEADVVILAVPVGDEEEVATRISEVTRGKIVVRMINSMHDKEESRLQLLLPYSSVIEMREADLQELSSALRPFLN